MGKLERDITASRDKELVPDDKFERHFSQARKNDKLSNEAIFCNTTEITQDRNNIEFNSIIF